MKKLIYILGVSLLLFNVMFFASPIKGEALNNKQYNRRVWEDVEPYLGVFSKGKADSKDLEELQSELYKADYNLKLVNGDLEIYRMDKVSTWYPDPNMLTGRDATKNIDDTSVFSLDQDKEKEINDALSCYGGSVVIDDDGFVISIPSYDPISSDEPEEKEVIEKYDGKTTCEIVVEVYGLLKYFAAAFLVVFASLDMIKALTAGDQEKMKTAQKNAVTRIGAGTLIFLLPTIVRLIMEIAGLDYAIGACFGKL